MYLNFKPVTFCYTLSAISFVTSNTTATKSVGIILANSMNRALVTVVSTSLLDICVVAKHCRKQDQRFILHVITVVFTYPWTSLKVSLDSLDQIFIFSSRKINYCNWYWLTLQYATAYYFTENTRASAV